MKNICTRVIGMAAARRCCCCAVIPVVTMSKAKAVGDYSYIRVKLSIGSTVKSKRADRGRQLLFKKKRRMPQSPGESIQLLEDGKLSPYVDGGAVLRGSDTVSFISCQSDAGRRI